MCYRKFCLCVSVVLWSVCRAFYEVSLGIFLRAPEIVKDLRARSQNDIHKCGLTSSNMERAVFGTLFSMGFKKKS